MKQAAAAKVRPKPRPAAESSLLSHAAATALQQHAAMRSARRVPAAHPSCGCWSCACSSPSGGATSLRSSSNAASTDRLAPCAACVARCSDAVLARSCRSAFSAQRQGVRASARADAPRRGTARSAPFLARALFSDLRSNESMRAPAQQGARSVNPACVSQAQPSAVGLRQRARTELELVLRHGHAAHRHGRADGEGRARRATAAAAAPPVCGGARRHVSAACPRGCRHARRARGRVAQRVRGQRSAGKARAHRAACFPPTALRCRPRAAPRCTRSPAGGRSERQRARRALQLRHAPRRLRPRRRRRPAQRTWRTPGAQRAKRFTSAAVRPERRGAQNGASR